MSAAAEEARLRAELRVMRSRLDMLEMLETVEVVRLGRDWKASFVDADGAVLTARAPSYRGAIAGMREALSLRREVRVQPPRRGP